MTIDRDGLLAQFPDNTNGDIAAVNMRNVITETSDEVNNDIADLSTHEGLTSTAHGGIIQEPANDANPKLRVTSATVSSWTASGGAAVLNIGTVAGTVAAGDHLHTGVYEPAFSKNTGFNLDLGTGSVNVAVGDHNHSGLYEPVFAKNTGFNLNLGTTGGTVSGGNHNHSSTNTVLDLVMLTQAEYDGLTPVATTLYLICG